ncbi:MAG: uncharacterized protein QOH06_2813 [Acidobacteriota bacterium]|jgi:uncharacterized membrane protein YfcA|nr:uncharacterized protein [Acidobacteriota bacterium]
MSRSLVGFLLSIPVAILGGLIGLGGAEFRLPVLAGPMGHPVQRAVPLNLAVSLATLATALLLRSRTLPFSPLLPLVPAVLALLAGAVTAAFFGASFAHRLPEARLERVIVVLLVTIGFGLIAEAFLPHGLPALVPASLAWRVPIGLVLGLGIGLVSSLLGVAGGELIIPTLVFAFGADIRTAGTGSLLISLPTVLVGVGRYASLGAFRERKDLRETVLPMSLGSVIGAAIGGILVAYAPQATLKVGLGVILVVSALKTFTRPARPARRKDTPATPSKQGPRP